MLVAKRVNRLKRHAHCYLTLQSQIEKIHRNKTSQPIYQEYIQLQSWRNREITANGLSPTHQVPRNHAQAVHIRAKFSREVRPNLAAPAGIPLAEILTNARGDS